MLQISRILVEQLTARQRSEARPFSLQQDLLAAMHNVPCWKLQQQNCLAGSSCTDAVHKLLPAHILALLSSLFLWLQEAALATQTSCIVLTLLSLQSHAANSTQHTGLSLQGSHFAAADLDSHVSSLPLLVMQDPAMANFMQQMSSPNYREDIEAKMEALKEDPEMAPIMKEIEEGGPSAMMK